MSRSVRITFRHAWYDDLYTIDFLWDARLGYYRMRVAGRPRCRHPVGHGRAHVLDEDRLCVSAGCEPRTLARAKALAMRWLHGFSRYRRSGVFPEDPLSIDLRD